MTYDVIYREANGRAWRIASGPLPREEAYEAMIQGKRINPEWDWNIRTASKPCSHCGTALPASHRRKLCPTCVEMFRAFTENKHGELA